MIEISKEYLKDHGFCVFKKDDSLLEVTDNIPEKGYGVFILRKNKEDGDILYIGYSGTIDKETGKFKKQQLKGRINNKHGKVKRQVFFDQQMREDKTLQKIYIEWCIIDEKKRLPSDVKADLLEQYHVEHKCLPRWSRTF